MKLALNDSRGGTVETMPTAGRRGGRSFIRLTGPFMKLRATSTARIGGTHWNMLLESGRMMVSKEIDLEIHLEPEETE